MNTNTIKLYCSTVWLLWLTLPVLRCHAQAGMTVAQARQALLPDVQPPDTTLPSTPIVGSFDGHTQYEFDGNGGGGYSIDAVTGEKQIMYAGLSAADKQAQTPDNPLTAAQLQQVASAFVAQHFPGYNAASFQMVAPPVDIVDDGDEYYVDFVTTAPSGATLPIHCLVIVEEDTGKVKCYEETSILVTVNTTPNYIQAQAIQIGQNWIYQNLSTDPAAGQFQTDLGGRSPIKFYVNVDALLNETLIYQIFFSSIVLSIDALSGQVVDVDYYAGATPTFRSGPKLAADSRESLVAVHSSGGFVPLGHAAIQTHGRVYLWGGYLKALGISTLRSKNLLTLTSAKRRCLLKVKTIPTGSNTVAWEREGSMYLPLAAVRSLTSSVAKNPNTQEIVLTMPKIEVVKR